MRGLVLSLLSLLSVQFVKEKLNTKRKRKIEALTDSSEYTPPPIAQCDDISMATARLLTFECFQKVTTRGKNS